MVYVADEDDKSRKGKGMLPLKPGEGLVRQRERERYRETERETQRDRGSFLTLSQRRAVSRGVA